MNARLKSVMAVKPVSENDQMDCREGHDSKSEEIESDEQNDELEEEECDFKPSKGITAPHRPSRREIEEHMRTHVPFKAWCPHCVRGKAKSRPHFRSNNSDREAQVPVIAIDYMYMNEDDEESDSNTIVVLKDRSNGTRYADTLPAKGRDAYSVERLDRNLRSLGHSRIILKTDQEPAIEALKETVRERLTIEIIPEQSPKYESASNGMIERAIQSVQD